MAFSRMSSKEKTIVAVLAVVIVLSLVGIGILAAQLIGNDDEGEGGTVAVTSATPATTVGTPGGGEEAEITPVATPALETPEDVPPPIEGDAPVAVAQAESPGPLAPAIITDQVLFANHRYEIEIRAADGSQLAIQGSWSQAATSTGGQVTAPQIEFFEGVTPHTIQVGPPVADPARWGCSVSASLKEPVGKTTHLVITIWDVTGVE
jgi:hypothetical protein